MTARVAGSQGRPSTEVETRSLEIAVEDGSIPVRMYLPRHRPVHSRLLWIHGGAFVGGTLDGRESDAVARSFAELGVAVLCVGYRLVPPFSGAKRWFGRDAVRFPVPIDDCLAAWEHLVSSRDATDAPLFVGGASAGGNLAAMSIVHAAARRLAPPAGVILAYPLLDHTAPSPVPGARSSVLRSILGLTQRVWVTWMGRVFVGRTSGHSVSDAFPSTHDLRSFPPTHIITADKDLLRFSGEAFADRLRHDGIDVTLGVEPGTSHGYLIRPKKPAYARSLASFVDWMRCTGTDSRSATEQLENE